MAVVKQRYIGVEEFLKLTERVPGGSLLELVAGEVRWHDGTPFEPGEGETQAMCKPTLGHGEIVMWLSIIIGSYVYENDLGRITGGDAGFIFEREEGRRNTVRGLDLAFISKRRAPQPLPFNLGDFAPDLAIEVISPGNQADDIHRKVRQLLKAGTALIWLIYPDTRTVAVHTPTGAVTLEETDTLAGGEVLPGFAIPVSDIFPK